MRQNNNNFSASNGVNGVADDVGGSGNDVGNGVANDVGTPLTSFTNTIIKI